jgi:hypothetical protein
VTVRKMGSIMKKEKLTSDQILEYRKTISQLSNSGKYKQAYALSLKLTKQYPDVIMFQYLEAVFTAEDTRHLTKKQTEKKYAIAAKKLKLLLIKLRNVDPKLRKSIRNEYYWFSKQPYKQYLLGIESNKNGQNGYYSMGVGASRLALEYGRKQRKKLCLKWSKISEKAWLRFFKADPNWFNAYYFYAVALGLQGKTLEMNKALKMGSKISGIPVSDEMFQEAIREVESVKFL